MVQFSDSSFRFTSPIRYFKANDPIYYEVDNIPLKQLQENDLWLKDQLQNLPSSNSSDNEIDRSSFSELKPYVAGTDNVVKVKPGRFTARINDAYSITPLQYIQNITGSSVNEYDTWLAKSSADLMISSVVDKFRANIITDALNMNGLTERAFSYPAVTPNRANSYLSASSPVITTVNSSLQFNIQQPLYPLRDNQLWGNFTREEGQNSLTNFVIKQYDTNTVLVGFAALSTAEPEFIKRWRGVARTSVVDVAEEISIEVPPFNANDFFYVNENNQKINLTNATQRIDLIFIYAKPIDASSTTIAKYVSTGQPTTITAPMLGIVQGAGVGMDFRSASREFKRIQSGVTTESNVGSLRMLAHVGDEGGQNSGFTISGVPVRGSFPSPDDLMNLTPILDEQLAANHYGLIGQSILPIAYVVVKKIAGINEDSVNVITNQDIIDIRPFFRTTELSYNERAGLAAAVPAPSFANPIVTQAELKYELNRAIQSVYSNPPTPTTPTGTSNTNTTVGNVVLGMGYVFGGLKYGPEGVFANKLATQNVGDSETEIEAKVKQKCSIPSGVTIPILPDWDKAIWLEDVPGAQANKVNDRINLFTTYLRFPQDSGGASRWDALNGRANQIAKYVDTNAYPYVYNTARASISEWTNGNGWTERVIIPPATNNKGISNNFWFVRKKFYITLPTNISDYFVDVKLFNCLQNVMIGSAGWDDLTPPQNFTSNSIWVEKGVDTNNQKYFTINVAFSSRPLGDRDISYYNAQNDRFGAEYNFWSYNYLQNLINAELDPNEISNDGNNDNSLTKVYGRGGHRAKSVRDVGELTANWLATSDFLIRENYTDRTEKGGVAMGVCNYPSIMFTITGIRGNSLINTSQTNNTSVINFGNFTNP